MAYFSVPNVLGGTQQNLSSTFKSLCVAYGTTGALCRGKIMELGVGMVGAPNATDCNVEFDVSPMTAVGSIAGTAATPQPRDTGGGANFVALSTAKINITTEPTVTASASVWYRVMNQRGSYQWVARDEYAGLAWAATAGVGLVLRARSATFADKTAGEIDFLEG